MEDFSYDSMYKECSKILQSRWNDIKYDNTRLALLNSYAYSIKQVSEAVELDKYAKRVMLILMVEELRDTFPTEFNEIGWYDRKVAIERR